MSNGPNRRINKLETRVTKLEKENEKMLNDIANIQKRFEKNDKRVKMLQNNSIINDLQLETFTGSGRYLYTYEDLATRYEVSTYEICKIAEAAGLSRRSKKSN